MPRYVILFHQMPAGRPRGSHWDLMLECGAALRTWALAEPPRPGRPIAAEALPDHRLAYLDYEGPVSGDRGSVTRWDQGQIQQLVETPNGLTVQLRGERLQGQIVLRPCDPAGGSWEFLLHPATPNP